MDPHKSKVIIIKNDSIMIVALRFDSGMESGWVSSRANNLGTQIVAGV